MDSKDIRNLQEAYLDVYQEVDEATKMAKLGYDEVDIRNKIAAKTSASGAGKFADKATELADKPTYGDKKKKEGREKFARTQRGDFRDTTSSSPGLRGYGFKSNDPAVKAKQDARGNQRARAALTPNERKQLNMEFDLYDAILAHLLDEGYADTNEAALAIMGNMSEDWKYSILEDVRGGPSFSSTPIIDAGKKIVGGILDRYRNGSSKEPNIPQKPVPKSGPVLRDEPLWDGPDDLPTKPQPKPQPQPKPKPGPVLRDEPLF